MRNTLAGWLRGWLQAEPALGLASPIALASCENTKENP